jgi:hypothetical protein
MATEEGKSSFLNRLKDATNTIATRAREEVEELQTRHELSQTYSELGRVTAGLVESGALSHAEFTPLVDKIRELKAELAASPEAAPPTEPEAGPSTPAPPAPPAG